MDFLGPMLFIWCLGGLVFAGLHALGKAMARTCPASDVAATKATGETLGINPVNGLPMVNELQDIAGNPRWFSESDWGSPAAHGDPFDP